MTRLLLSLLLLIAWPVAPVDRPRATLISRVVVASSVISVYDLASGAYPVIDAPGGDKDVQLVQDAQGWRGRVVATLPLCEGALVVDGVTVTQQRCQWLPVGMK